MKTYSGNKWINRPFFFMGKWNFTSLHCVSTPMKGGHTHNHVLNAELRTKFRSKDERFKAKY